MRLHHILLSATLIFAGCVPTKKAAVSAVEPIRGTWITNVASDALRSEENIKEAVSLCKENGLNSIFVVVWNGGVTIYPSQVLNKYIGIMQDTVYKNFDPLKTIVAEGHKQGLKVHAWFEFGFSYAYKDSNSLWLQKYPAWAGRNVKGELLNKNGFYWWNSINPDVQLFMKSLVSEVVKNYDIDGIQGDDRLPAMPAEGGYDAYTAALYKKQTGNTPPTLYNDPTWLQWKADQLSSFGKMLYKEVKDLKPNCTVSWAPSLYPWSKEQYLQDWPRWLSEGYADYIIPQLYRYKIADYERILKELDVLIPAKDKDKVFPGILTSLGDDNYQSTRELTDQMIKLNRAHGFNGEVFFYFETLHRLKGKFYTN